MGVVEGKKIRYDQKKLACTLDERSSLSFGTRLMRKYISETFLVFKHHSNTRTTKLYLTQALKVNAAAVRKIPDELSNYRVVTIDVALGLTVVFLVENGEAFVCVVVFFHIPIDGGLDKHIVTVLQWSSSKVPSSS